MKRPTLDLRAKIFLGGALLLVPLAITLGFLSLLSLDQLGTARKELEGLSVSEPLVDVAIRWTEGGAAGRSSPELAGALDAYLAAAGPAAPRIGAVWDGAESPEADLKAGPQGDSILFAGVTRTLLAELRKIANNSGLVLDPDLDSYYTVLPIYDGLPSLLEQVAALQGLLDTNPGGLSGRAKVSLAIGVDQLEAVSSRMQDWIERSLSATGPRGAALAGYADAVRPKVEDLAITAAGLRRPGLAMAEGAEAWDPEVLRPKLLKVTEGLEPFHEVASPALRAMLNNRIAGLTNRLVLSWASALGGLVLSTAVFLVLGNGIRRRSGRLVHGLELLAEGDLTQPLDRNLARGGDELARLARAVSRVRDDLGAAVGAIRQVNEKLAALGSGLAATAEESASAIEEMAASAAQVAKLADHQQSQTDEASGNVVGLVERIGESNQLTQGMATQFFLFSQAMEANRRRIQATSTEAAETGRLAEDLDRTGEDGQRSLEALRTSIGSVAQQTQQIQEIVLFILDIADRTNLLSMNAGIEAAHAGNQGRGFKVVADEIRKLAETSGVQAQNIRALVEGIASAAETTLQRSEATGSSFHRLREDIAAMKNASQAIASQIAHQEAEDTKLTAGLEEFTRFYSDLSGSMDIETTQSEAIQSVMANLADSSRQISLSTAEQRVGMGQATDAVVQMRDTSMDVARILDELNELLGRFRT